MGRRRDSRKEVSLVRWGWMLERSQRPKYREQGGRRERREERKKEEV